MNTPSSELIPKHDAVPRVTRSPVPPGKDYENYRGYLRFDFFYSCAYCMISEAEAAAVGFAIDHYEPRKARPDLEHEYSNLMYACDPCNVRKSDRCPPQAARQDGWRFFRPDDDFFHEHFELRDVRLNHKSNTGLYTIEALDLNRFTLRRLRAIRRRLSDCSPLVSEGIRGLRQFHLDQLPPHIKGTANRAIRDISKTEDKLSGAIDDLLRRNARSYLVDDDPEAQARGEERAQTLKNWTALYPGNWRAPRAARRKQ